MASVEFFFYGKNKSAMGSAWGRIGLAPVLRWRIDPMVRVEDFAYQVTRAAADSCRARERKGENEDSVTECGDWGVLIYPESVDGKFR